MIFTDHTKKRTHGEAPNGFHKQRRNLFIYSITYPSNLEFIKLPPCFYLEKHEAITTPTSPEQHRTKQGPAVRVEPPAESRGASGPHGGAARGVSGKAATWERLCWNAAIATSIGGGMTGKGVGATTIWRQWEWQEALHPIRCYRH